jgi:hypothetical protein
MISVFFNVLEEDKKKSLLKMSRRFSALQRVLAGYMTQLCNEVVE